MFLIAVLQILSEIYKPCSRRALYTGCNRGRMSKEKEELAKPKCTERKWLHTDRLSYFGSKAHGIGQRQHEIPIARGNHNFHYSEMKLK